MSANLLSVSDDSNGYEAIAAEFIAIRGAPGGTRRAIGVRTVREWARPLRSGGAVLDLGCESGYPATQVLVDARLAAHGVDASPRMVAAFRTRFPGVAIECNDVARSNFLGREVDGVVAWGLLFLLRPDAQAQLLAKVGRALTRGNRFLFTAPREVCEWSDSMTGRLSESLGAEVYRRLLENAGLELIDEMDDEGENHYYVAPGHSRCRHPGAQRSRGPGRAPPHHHSRHLALRGQSGARPDSRGAKAPRRWRPPHAECPP